MKAFASLLDQLSFTHGRNDKLRLLVRFFDTTPDPARGFALAALTGDLKLPAIKSGLIRELIQSRMDGELFAMSYDFVGDLAETVALAWPSKPGANAPPDFTDVVETLTTTSREQGMMQIECWLDACDASQRWALLKLITRGLRIGVSARLAKQALANYGDKAVNDIEEIWHGLSAPYEDLFAWLEDRADKPTVKLSAPFRPVMLAHPFGDASDNNAAKVMSPEAYAFEWKWDGARVQAVAGQDDKRLYSRKGDDMSDAFPDIIQAMNFNAALDGELLIRTPNGGVAPFNVLQQRLNRKRVSKSMLAKSPAFIRVYDILVEGEEDLRSLPFRERRARLETFIVSLNSPQFDLSPLVQAVDINELEGLRSSPPTPEIEGLMMKAWSSPYTAGRPTGPWWKWKKDPYLIDAVLMYAQRGHGRRSGTFSDFTFGVWTQTDGETHLTPVGKAYFGFTDEELKEINGFIRKNTRERFGPVAAIEATLEHGLVLEVAFEGIHRSPRHKSGVAMRFPRIHRIRWDKPTKEADRLETLELLITAREDGAPA